MATGSSGAGDAGGQGGQGGLQALLGGATGAAGASGAGGSPASALAGPAVALINQQLGALGEEIKRGVRELRLTVTWPDGRHTESFTVVTHLVILGTAADRAQRAAQQNVQQLQQLQQQLGQPAPVPTP